MLGQCSWRSHLSSTYLAAFSPAIRPELITQLITVLPMFTTKKQTLNIEIDEKVNSIFADEPKMRQIFLNLLSNAHKFTPKGGNITLRARKEDSSLLIEIQDNGIGIAKDAQPRLFKPYSRLSADRQSHPGLGLGLALSKQVVELHGGKIWVDSEPGQGSTFAFSLPLDARK